jgi:hypothetical protein
MTPKLKIVIQIASLVLLLAFTSFITIKFQDWFYRTEIKIVFDECSFKDEPTFRPVKDRTTYLLKRCKIGPNAFGEFISPQEVDEAISKIEKGEK